MKYFEVNDPYYALIKAENVKNAMEVYHRLVADADDGMDLKEIERDKALIKYSQAMGEDKTLINPGEIYKEFNDDVQDILLIDGALI